MAETQHAQETLIAAEIDALRARHTDTRSLYREVCALLFFRFGITPTANKLYQYVRKGSMATPAQVLSGFWSDLRERTRVRIDHPDLPPALRDAAGELVLHLWGRAQQEAADTFALQSEQADREVAAARVDSERAARDSAALKPRLEAMTNELADARAQAVDSGRQLATIQGRLASMTEMLRDQADEMRVLREELAISGRDVARTVGEANALRVQLALARRKGARKPMGGVPQEPDSGQEDLELDPRLESEQAQRAGESSPGTDEGRDFDPAPENLAGRDVAFDENVGSSRLHVDTTNRPDVSPAGRRERGRKR